MRSSRSGVVPRYSPRPVTPENAREPLRSPPITPTQKRYAVPKATTTNPAAASARHCRGAVSRVRNSRCQAASASMVAAPPM